MLLMQLTAGAATTFIAAVVDSGAARSMLPLQIAERLGVSDALVEDEVGAQGVEGIGFSTWSLPDGVEAQVLSVTQASGTVIKWGTSFTLSPAFCDKDPFLLGREDFFATFRVSFDPGNPHPTFSIAER
jgi:hypothetical protein